MALMEQLLEKLEGKFGRSVWRQSADERRPSSSPFSLSLGTEALDALLPDGGLPRGAVVELALKGGAAWGTSLALAACRSAQQQALRQGGQEAWCAFVDPSRSLYGPGVLQAGVCLDRLLVVAAETEAVAQVALRIVRSRVFAVTVVDLRGVPGALLELSLARWPRVVRQLAAGGEGSQGTVLLLSEAHARRPLPLPVALRLELDRPHLHDLGVSIMKERHGRLRSRHVVHYPFEGESGSSMGSGGSSLATSGDSLMTGSGSSRSSGAGGTQGMGHLATSVFEARKSLHSNQVFRMPREGAGDPFPQRSPQERTSQVALAPHARWAGVNPLGGHELATRLGEHASGRG